MDANIPGQLWIAALGTSEVHEFFETESEAKVWWDNHKNNPDIRMWNVALTDAVELKLIPPVPSRLEQM